MTDFSFALLTPMMPELFLAVAGLFLLVLGVFHGDKGASSIGWLASIAFLVAGAILLQNGWERTTILDRKSVV